MFAAAARRALQKETSPATTRTPSPSATESTPDGHVTPVQETTTVSDVKAKVKGTTASTKNKTRKPSVRAPRPVQPRHRVSISPTSITAGAGSQQSASPDRTTTDPSDSSASPLESSSDSTLKANKQAWTLPAPAPLRPPLRTAHSSSTTGSFELVSNPSSPADASPSFFPSESAARLMDDVWPLPAASRRSSFSASRISADSRRASPTASRCGDSQVVAAGSEPVSEAVPTTTETAPAPFGVLSLECSSTNASANTSSIDPSSHQSSADPSLNASSTNPSTQPAAPRFKRTNRDLTAMMRWHSVKKEHYAALPLAPPTLPPRPATSSQDTTTPFSRSTTPAFPVSGTAWANGIDRVVTVGYTPWNELKGGNVETVLELFFSPSPLPLFMDTMLMFGGKAGKTVLFAPTELLRSSCARFQDLDLVQHQPIHLTDEHFGDVRAFLRFAAAKKKADLFLTLPAVRGVQKIMLAWQARMELVEDFRAYVALHAARLVFCSVNPNATGNINAHANTAELETEAHSPSRGHLIALLRNLWVHVVAALAKYPAWRFQLDPARMNRADTRAIGMPAFNVLQFLAAPDEYGASWGGGKEMWVVARDPNLLFLVIKTCGMRQVVYSDNML